MNYLDCFTDGILVPLINRSSLEPKTRTIRSNFRRHSIAFLINNPGGYFDVNISYSLSTPRPRPRQCGPVLRFRRRAVPSGRVPLPGDVITATMTSLGVASGRDGASRLGRRGSPGPDGSPGLSRRRRCARQASQARRRQAS